jgi:hypothetical protein
VLSRHLHRISIDPIFQPQASSLIPHVIAFQNIKPKLRAEIEKSRAGKRKQDRQHNTEKMSQPGQPCPVCQEFKKGPFDELLRIEKLREVPLRAIQLRKDEGCKSCALLCDGIDLLSDRWSPRRFLDEDQSELLVSWRTPVKGQPFRIRLSEDCYHKNPKERYILDLCEIEFIVRAGKSGHLISRCLTFQDPATGYYLVSDACC